MMPPSQSSESSTRLIMEDFPLEILIAIFSNVPFLDLVSVSLTCRRFHSAISGQKWVSDARLSYAMDELYRLCPHFGLRGKPPKDRAWKGQAIFKPCTYCGGEATVRKFLFRRDEPNHCIRCHHMKMKTMLEEAGGVRSLEIGFMTCSYVFAKRRWVPNQWLVKKTGRPGLHEVTGDAVGECPDCGEVIDQDAKCWKGVEGCSHPCKCHGHCDNHIYGCELVNTPAYWHMHCALWSCGGIYEVRPDDPIQPNGRYCRKGRLCSVEIGDCHGHEVGERFPAWRKMVNGVPRIHDASHDPKLPGWPRLSTV